MGKPLFDYLRDLHRKRRTALDKLASVERLGNDSKAWEEVFRHPEWAPPPVGHRGRCGKCNTPVELAETTCPACGAQWAPNARKRDTQTLWVILAVAIALSVAIGYGCAQGFAAFYHAKLSRDGGNEDFVGFARSYLWFTCSILSVFAFTYLAERLKIAQAGFWRTPPGAAATAPSGDRRGARG
jgi:hypothetical protein